MARDLAPCSVEHPTHPHLSAAELMSHLMNFTPRTRNATTVAMRKPSEECRLLVTTRCSVFRMSAVLVSVLAALLAASVSDVDGDDTTRTASCDDPHKTTSAMRLQIESRRNESGHWISNVRLVHNENGAITDDPWLVDVQRSSDLIDGKRFIVITSIISSPQGYRGGHARITKRSLADLGEYTYHMTPATWQDASNICKKLKLRLAVIDSDKEAYAVADTMKELTADTWTQGIHVGLKLKEGQPGYQTVNGSSKWSSPLPREGECVGMNTDGLLVLNACHHLLPFFCEKWN